MNDERIVTRVIEEEMRHAYIDYSMSVIVSRALPDVRDGLKPVHRRVLYSMSELGLASNRAHKKSARIVGECFVKGTLVSTPTGLQKIENLQIGQEVCTHRGVQKVTELYEMPAQALLTISTRNGSQNIATPGQMLKVFTPALQYEWKRADELQVGDYIVNKSFFPSLSSYNKVATFTIDEDLAYLLGVFYSDGWIDRDKQRGYDRVCFCSDRLEVLEKLQTIISQKWQVTTSIHEKDKYAYLKINANTVNQALIQTFGLQDKYANNIAIPEAILQSPQSVVYSFISAYIDGDGSVHHNRTTLNVTSVSETFARQFHTLLLSLGIHAALYESKRDDKQNAFSVEVNGAAYQKLVAKLSLQHPEKQEKLRLENETLASVHEKIPFLGKYLIEEFSEKHLGGGWYEGANGEKVRTGLKYPDGTKIRYAKNLAESFEVYQSTLEKIGVLKKMEAIQSAYLQTVHDIVENHISFSEVTAISQEVTDITYDIQVENDHEFVANGMLVHNCLGKYHPHGDTAVYDTMVRMAQPWSLRYPLVDGQGNFGSVDGDNPAAMRYTEARLRKIAEDILADLEKNTVDFRPNFDDSLTEPSVLPGRIPNLLVNGTSGIAVGMATNMAPHNLCEIVDAICAYVDNKDITMDELLKFVKGPDFPTGATIYGTNGIYDALTTGRGRIVIRANAEIITTANDREQIIINEIPYQVNKANTIKKIDQLINEKKLEGIADINDESDRDGMRIVIDIKKEASANVVLNQLYQQTQLQNSFSVNNVALVKGRPMTLNLKDLIRHYVDHRHEIVVRRTQYDLDEARKRAHILEGLLVAIDNLDEVISLIRASRTPDEALSSLTSRVWKTDSALSTLLFREAILAENGTPSYQLSDVQAKAILEMRLQRLTGLERDKILDQYKEIKDKIDYYESVLANEDLRMAIIKAELVEVKATFGDARRTQIVHAEGEINYEDTIENEDVIVTISHQGYVKRTSMDEYKVQNRGGVGVKGAGTKQEDFVEYIFSAKTHNYLLVFTEKGRCFWLKVYVIPKGDKTSKGRAIQNLIQIDPDDKIKAFVTVDSLDDKEFTQNHSIIMVTKKGTVKKTSLEAYSRPRVNGINAISINEGDELIEAKLTSGKSQVIIAISTGRAIRFLEEEVRDMGRTATGVRGIRFDSDNAEVVGMVTIEDPKSVTLLVVSANGYGKRTGLVDAETGEEIYRITSRGGKGVRTINITEKTGSLIAIKKVDETKDIMIITKNGITIRMDANAVSASGRATQGVRLIRLREGDEIASVTSVEKVEASEENPEIDTENLVIVGTPEAEEMEADDTIIEEDDAEDEVIEDETEA